MRVYKLSSTESAERLEALPDHYAFEHSAMASKPIERFEEYNFGRAFFDHRDRELLDITFIQHLRTLPLFSDRIAQVLKTNCGLQGHWHSTNVDGNAYQLLNIVDCADAVDESNSDIVYWPPVKQRPNRPTGIKSYDSLHFHLDVVEPLYLFRDRVLASFNLFCTDQFMDLAESVNLTGLSCQLVWDSDHAPFKFAPHPAEALARPEIYGPDGLVFGYTHLWN